MQIIEKYFPTLTTTQHTQFTAMQALYDEWNSKINVVSRKDISNLYCHHILHSLAIAKTVNFRSETEILDVGSGGGFPGIPLAVLFPEIRVTCIDSVGKKAKVTEEIAKALNLSNVTVRKQHSREVKQKFDFVVARAVTTFPDFVNDVKHTIHTNDKNSLPNGIFYLTGGDVTSEISAFKKHLFVYEIKELFSEEYFSTKKIVYLPI